MIFKEIFKREKPSVSMPRPMFENNWKQEQFQKNVNDGVASLQAGRSIVIHDDGRGYELAIEIKHRFIAEYQKQLSEKIKISGGDVIRISMVDECN